MDLTLVGMTLGVGFGLGMTRPTLGLGLLVAIVAPLSSLPWQLGSSNLSLPTAYLFALAVGLGARWIGDPARRRRAADRMGALSSVSTAAVALCVAIVVSTVIALARNELMPSSALPSVFRAELGHLALFNPSGLAGTVQAGWILLAGPLIFLATSIVLVEERCRRLVYASFLVGGLIAVVSPLLQLAFLNPWVRPDLQTAGSREVAGFFQDPHSYAAYLIIAIGLSTAFGFRALASGRGALAGLFAAAVAGGFVSLFFSGSRSGLAIGLGVLASTIAMVQFVEKRTAGGSERAQRAEGSGPSRAPRVAAAVIVVGLAVLAGLLVHVGSQDPGFADRINRNRIVRTFESERPTSWRIQRRLELWETALRAAAQRPLWGAGPKALATGIGLSEDDLDAPAPGNTHNDYLQLGAEHGLPVLALFLLLLARVTARMVAGLTGPPAGAPLPGILAAHLGVAAYCVITHPLLLAELQGCYWVLLGLGMSQDMDATP